MIIKIVKNIIEDILIAFYEPFWFSVILAVLSMFFWMYAKEHGTKNAIKIWWRKFREDITFRRMFYLVFYTAMILFRTLLNRSMWMNPLSDVIGIWGLYREKNGEMIFTTEVPENLIMFIPFVVLLFWTFGDKLLKKFSFLPVLWQSVKITFLFSFCIEMLQLLLRLGTWQLSDIVYNTLGGAVGGLLYWVWCKIRHVQRSNFR